MSFHQNAGKCPGCQTILNRYPGFHPGLRAWFERLQIDSPEAHISCAGRGQIDQEALFVKKATRAHWLESSHNYNAALDIFRNVALSLYDTHWFQQVVSPALTNPKYCHTPGNPVVQLSWLGRPGSPFPELPHVQLKDWVAMRKSGLLIPVQ